MSGLLLLWACNGGGNSDDSAKADSGDTATASDALSLSLEVPAGPMDECDEACFSATVTLGGEPVHRALVDIWVGDYALGADLMTDKDGVATACGTGLATGEFTVIATVEVGADHASATGAVSLRPFGYADGFIKDEMAVDDVPWTPTFERVGEGAVLPPGAEGEWDAVGTIVPSVAKTDNGWVMWYAGTAATDYVVGVATSTDGIRWTKDSANPLFSGDGVEGSWRQYSTNSPMIVEHDGTWNLFYTGRAGEDGDLTIGLATGSDPDDVTDIDENPVFRWTEDEESWAGEAVAHPAVLVNEDGWWEMWYSTGYHRIGYAYSADGRDWRRYCHNPMFTGDTGSTWEGNMVKANEVVLHNDWYMMTYTGGETGAFQLGWAMSRDGIHWARAAEPVLSPAAEAGTWESSSILSAPMVVDGDELKLWYSGTGASQSAVGYAIASLEGAP